MSKLSGSGRSLGWFLLTAVLLLAAPAASSAPRWDSVYDHHERSDQRPAPNDQGGPGDVHRRQPAQPHDFGHDYHRYTILPSIDDHKHEYEQQAPNHDIQSDHGREQHTTSPYDFRQSSPTGAGIGSDDYHFRHSYRHLRPGEAVDDLPGDYDTIHSRDRDYYLYGGHFFQRAERGFVVVRPPFGAVFLSLPADYIPVDIGNSRYFFCDGTYFQPSSSGYAVVKPPHPTTTATMNAVSNVAELNVRLGPGTNYGVIDSVNDGAELPVYGHTQGWYYVQTHDGTFGWVRSSSTVPLQFPQS